HKLPHAAFNPEVLLHRAEFPAEIQQLLVQKESESPHIKEEEMWSSQEGEQLQDVKETDITNLPFILVPVKRGDSEQTFQPSQFHQSQNEEDREAESFARSSTVQTKTETDGVDCGGLEATIISGPGLLPTVGDDKATKLSEPENEDNEDGWKETREPQSGSSTLENNEVSDTDMQCNTGKKCHSCTECVATFRNKGDLKIHMTTHRRKSPISCLMCCKKFTTRKFLNCHMKCHSAEKPFSCSVCMKHFGTKTETETHMRTNHTDVHGVNATPATATNEMEAPALDNDWHFNFSIPWNIMPSHIGDTLNNQKRPSARDRREIIRLITAEILAVCKNPIKKHLSEIARKMVLAYPKSFKDIIEGVVVGTGYDSITKQLQCRVDNIKRVQPPTKTPPNSENRKNKRRNGTYGCITEPQAVVNVESQEKNREELLKMFEENEADKKKIEMLMIATFASQRKDVLNEKDPQILKDKWPYLFHPAGMRAHFRQLTGVHINEEFEEDMDKKLKRVLQYFRYLYWERGSRAAQLLYESQSASEGSRVALLMLLLHFKEDGDKMIVQVDDNDTAAGVRREDLPPTPCIVVCGDGPLAAAEFMVAVDRVVVMDRNSTFSEAVVVMFMAYYVMNIDYPVELGATLEFLQRCVFRINPDHGSKVEK
ncbi:hypothetical protein LDENG_00209580, partial [Lucifuga dentata]